VTGPRLGGSPRGGDVLALVLADLRGWDHERRDATTACVTPPGGPTCTLEVRAELRKLMRLHTTAVHLDGPATDSGAHLVLRHTGQVRRRGLAARIRGTDGDGQVARLQERLLADGELEAASLALDFTRFEVAPVDGRWRATLELMGASHVWTRIPPGGSYVRLAEDQVEALAATLRVLADRLPATPATADRTRVDLRPDDPAPPPRHLPPRR
jgi:hypothetical protein